jgi:hypothetical protein
MLFSVKHVSQYAFANFVYVSPVLIALVSGHGNRANTNTLRKSIRILIPSLRASVEELEARARILSF